ncbi:hypothetical protein [Effusibacillus consociatus]|uniref:IraD/Gp25-like domain-containing protein n=1 Tax=Effusibacillus consociatus TaxID=1117041 RepID=A0ABV9PYG8_9BACL
MADREKEKHSKPDFSPLPKSYEHRASMKWITIESVRVVLERLKEQTDQRIVLLTPVGFVEGELTDIAPSYSESFKMEFGEDLTPDITSMVANLRIDLLRMIEKHEDKLEIIDSAPLIGLKNVTVRSSGQIYQLPEITIFADQVAGFAVSRQFLI